ncbi:hydroxymethylbilane synthase [Leucobacter sp. HY1910]
MTTRVPVVRGPVAARKNLIRVGTRGSELAVTQTTGVARQIAAATGCDVALVIVTTKGDTSPAPLAQLGGTGVFVSALRDALIAGQCDVAVHSLKDLPTGECPGITLGAIPARADARDALCARDGLTLAELPRAARVGTGSPRRSAQLLRRRPDLDVRDLRGNVDSRLARAGRDLDAVVLAAAGLLRIGRDPAITELFELDEAPTAPGQGALAVEVRSANEPDLAAALAAALTALDDAEARACALAERAVLATLEAGCQAPVGAWARCDGDTLRLTGVVYAVDGSEHVEATAEVSRDSDPSRLGAEVATQLLAAGAARIAPLTLLTQSSQSSQSSQSPTQNGATR